MFKLITKSCRYVFVNLEDLMVFLINKKDKFFVDGAFIKIIFEEDFEA